MTEASWAKPKRKTMELTSARAIKTSKIYCICTLVPADGGGVYDGAFEGAIKPDQVVNQINQYQRNIQVIF